MNNNIVYFLGAGASYNCLPVIENMPFRMSQFIELMKWQFKDDPRNDNFKKYDQLIKDIKIWGTPDQLAKNLFLNKDPRIFELKDLLSTFLIYEQLEKTSATEKYFQSQFSDGGVPGAEKWKVEKNKMHGFDETIDRRYLSFFNKICQRINDRTQPNNKISILSWNYDLQIERAYQETIRKNLRDTQLELQVYPSVFEEIPNLNDNIINNFSVIKLNGTGTFQSNDDESIFDTQKHKLDDDSLRILGNILLGSRQERKNLLKFSWDENLDKTIISPKDIAAQKIMSAKTIVVIGYSFPDLNRDIDRQIFGSERVQKIYIQDPKADEIINKLDRVKMGLSKKAESIEDVDDFLIPAEYWEVAKKPITVL